MFVLKIQRLEKLCRALQEERVALYSKIKEVRHSNSQCSPPTQAEEQVEVEGLTVEEVLEIQGGDPVLTEDMSRLREEQAKLQEFATALLAMPSDGEEEEEEAQEQEEQKEEDALVSAFSHFTSKAKEEKPAESQQVLEEFQEAKSHSQVILEEHQEVKVHNQDVLNEPQEIKSHSQEPSVEQADTQQVLEESSAELTAAPEVKGHSQEVVKELQDVKDEDHPVAPTEEMEPIAAAAAAAAEEALTNQPKADQVLPTCSEVPPTSASDPNKKETPKKKKKRSVKNAS